MMPENGWNLNRVWVLFLLLSILILVSLLSLLSIHIPLGRDQGVAAYFGWRILNGEAVYRDLYHFNFPGIFYSYALALKLFGLKPEAVNRSLSVTDIPAPCVAPNKPVKHAWLNRASG